MIWEAVTDVYKPLQLQGSRVQQTKIAKYREIFLNKHKLGIKTVAFEPILVYS